MEEGKILEQLSRIERVALLGAKQILTVHDLNQLYGFAPSYVYKLTCGRLIPHYRRGKTLYFKRLEVEQWLTTYRTASKEELQREAINHQIRKENGL